MFGTKFRRKWAHKILNKCACLCSIQLCIRQQFTWNRKTIKRYKNLSSELNARALALSYRSSPNVGSEIDSLPSHIYTCGVLAFASQLRNLRNKRSEKKKIMKERSGDENVRHDTGQYLLDGVNFCFIRTILALNFFVLFTLWAMQKKNPKTLLN